MKRILDDMQRAVVLSLARSAVEEFLKNRQQLSCPPQDFLHIPSAAFVTLKMRNELRGCIGSTHHHYPLGETIVRCAISAATQDPRFPPLTLTEYEQVQFEISILSEFIVIQSIQQIEPGVHGIMVTAGYSRGLLLPQVAVDHNWDRETFFAHVCRKAGLRMCGWPADGSTIVQIFTAEVFGESDLRTGEA